MGRSSEPSALMDSPSRGLGSTENHDIVANGLMRSSSNVSTSERTAITDFSGLAEFGSLDVMDGNYDVSIVMSPNNFVQSPVRTYYKDVSCSKIISIDRVVMFMFVIFVIFREI